MAERTWTEKQSLAMNTRDRTLLVSAGAGSGKTATLTERIIRTLLDESASCGIENMLIVTFTNAAVAELRERIGTALREAYRAHPENKHLEHQLYLFPGARILTIDAFCNEVLRASAERLGLNPAYRIADTAEIELLAASVLDSLTDAILDGAYADTITPEELSSLIDTLSGTREESSYAETLLSLYRKLSTHEEGVASLRPLIEEYKKPYEESRPFLYIREQMDALVGHYEKEFQRALAMLHPEDKCEGRVYQFLLPECTLLSSLASAKSYAARQALCADITFKNAPSIRTEDKTDAILSALSLRAGFKKDLVAYIGKFFTYTHEECTALYGRLAKELSVLATLLELFDTAFMAEKRARAMCEYSDIERYAYECLWQNGERTEYAISLAEQFQAVYIDEYQDVNRLQDKIFEAVSSDTSRFMVGDIKQSIYSFRSADPRIFAGMKRSFRPLDPEGEPIHSALFMSDNFRCDKGVIDFVNDLFDRILGLVGNSIGYVSEDRLIASKSQEGIPYRTPKILAVEPTPRTRADEDDEHEAISSAMLEARAVAKEIERVLAEEQKNDGKLPRPGDIAILLRSAKGRAEVFCDALAERGICSEIKDEGDLFLSPEVLLALSLLNAIDNPHKDVYLAGVMCSPLFRFTPDDLLLYKHKGGARTLYDSLLAYEGEEDGGRVKEFLARLASYRSYAEGREVDKLLSYLYEDTGLLALASTTGGEENLLLFYQYARSFEASTFRGLYAFISYINRLTARGTRFESQKDAGENPEAVKILTVHSSKGLEYPIVFLAGCGTPISDKDARGRIAYCEDFGLCLRLTDETGLLRVENPAHQAILHKRASLVFEEELRILYVALTRAREQLYLSGLTSSALDKFLPAIDEKRRTLDEYTARGLRSYLEIALTSLPLPSVTYLPYEEDAPEEDEEQGADNTEALPPAPYDDKRRTSLADTLTERLSFTYPDLEMTRLPEKLSVSKLTPTVLDGTEDEDTAPQSLNPPKKTTKHYDLPSFYDGTPKNDASLRGIATHTFLQFCDLERLKTSGVVAELSRLVAEEFFTKEEAALVRTDELEKFLLSPLFSRMCRAKKLWRELRFHIRLPAHEFTADPEKKAALGETKVLIQGVIDCILEEEDGTLTLIDYKTDRLTKRELDSPTLARRALFDKHGEQLHYYALAIREMFEKAPDRVEIYSLPLGDTVTL